MKLHLKATAAMLALAAWPAVAQPAPPAPNALETLGAMHHTGSTADWPEIPQTGAKADQVKQNLTKIKLPAGFHISLYALVPDARHIAVGPQGVADLEDLLRVPGAGKLSRQPFGHEPELPICEHDQGHPDGVEPLNLCGG